MTTAPRVSPIGENSPDPETVLAGFQPGGATLWQAWGATGAEIRDWSAVGSHPIEAAWWVAYRDDITIAVVEAVQKLDNPVEWLTSKIPTERLAAAASVSDDLDVIEPWATAPVFDPDETEAALADGFVHPDERAHWLTVNPADPVSAMLAAWGDNPTPNPNFTPADPHGIGRHCPWENPRQVRRAGIWLPDQYREWRLIATGTADHQPRDRVPHPGRLRRFPLWFAAVLHPNLDARAFAVWRGKILDDTRPYQLNSTAITSESDVALAAAAVTWQNRYGDMGVTPDRIADWNTAWDPSNTWVEHALTTWITIGDPDLAAAWTQTCQTLGFPATTGAQWHHAGFSPRDRDWMTTALLARGTEPNPDGEDDEGGMSDLETWHFDRYVIPIAGLVRRRGGTPADLGLLVEHSDQL